MRNLVFLFLLAVSFQSCKQREPATQSPASAYSEKHRPRFHFSPAANWMNDPNGMVYYDQVYHLFYQYNPYDKVWGPMHWGHATSSDLVHWSHMPVALSPDSLGTIFSGSAVIDKENSSGLGTSDNPPMVAIYTYHDAEKEKEGRVDFQTQGLAYSVDKGKTWQKYAHNPIIMNPGIRDFRDPKVFWHEASHQWILILVAQDHAELYGSKDLIAWKKLSEFGKEYGAHGGVWECPDLFQVTVEDEKIQKWVMVININPGAPNGGSGTQYFVGDFDGKKFTCDFPPEHAKWLDFGPDEYAGVTWSNAPNDRTIFLGWMSNWAYANKVPTSPWRSANTIPRDLSLVRIDGDLYVRSRIGPELTTLTLKMKAFSTMDIKDSLDLGSEVGFSISTSRLEGTVDARDFEMVLSNNSGQHLNIGYSSKDNRFFVDRHASGKNNFSDEFNNLILAPRMIKDSSIKFSVVLDVSSVEIFFDDGLTVLTCLFFPDDELDRLVIRSKEGVILKDFHVEQISGIWQSASNSDQ